jgi:hypothetical protein
VKSKYSCMQQPRQLVEKSGQLRSQTDLFYGKHPPSTQRIEGLVYSTVGLDSVANRRTFILPGIELGSSSDSERR